MASQYADALIQSMLMQRGGMTPGQAINQGTGQLVAALAARREKQQAMQDQQMQMQLARQLLGGQNPQNAQAAAFNQQNPGELGMVQTTPQRMQDPQQALQMALQNPQVLQQNPMLAQLLMQQMAPPESYTLAPGAVRMQGGRTIASNPQAEKESEILQKVRAAGYDPASPQGQAFARQILLKPGVEVNMNDKFGPVPPGYRRVPDPKSPTGSRLEQELGAPQAKLPAETAAKLGMLDAAEKSLGEAEKVLFPNDSFNRKAVTATWSPVRTGEAATLYNAMRDAVSNRLRAESGASITEQDINDATERFLPKPWDSKDEAHARLRRFRQFVSSYRNAVGAQEQNRVKFEDYPDAG